MARPYRYLFLSTPVGPLGSGAGGGVELNLANLTRVLLQMGSQVRVLAPVGSRMAELPEEVIEPVAGLPRPMRKPSAAISRF